MTLSKGPSSLKSNFEAPTGVITEIQRYSIKDGPGIRTTVFMKGCTLQCEWCSNPECLSQHPELLFNRRRCVHCGDCVEACSKRAISMDNEVLVIDRNICDACGECISCCPEDVLEIVGNHFNVDELVAEVMKDIVFYQVSGGGITFSGGEPLLQSEFVRDAVRGLKENGIHIVVDTAGNVPWENFAEVLPYTDLLLYDIKFVDGGKHKRFTGVENRLILANARRIAQHKIPMIVRLIILPGLNDSDQEIASRLEFIKELPNVDQVDLLPYHKLGLAKYERLGKVYEHSELSSPDEERMRSLSQIVFDRGFKVTIGG
jgi:pyruvate formate lyase activating enzyme